jgi:hypothetical protein
MDKQAIIDSLVENHKSFVIYIRDLTADEYFFSHQQKWSAAQQLAHIVLCVKPLVQVFNMNKSAIKTNFGVVSSKGRTYDILLNDYLGKLAEGGKAPEKYIPEVISSDQRIVLVETLEKMINDLRAGIENFTEPELDSLAIPHPLLGKLSMREMLYNAIYHVVHHHQLTSQNMKNITAG